MSEHLKRSRTAIYLLVPLFQALISTVSHTDPGQFLPHLESIIYRVGNWIVFWMMASAFTWAFTVPATLSRLPRWLLVFAGGLASAFACMVLSPWYDQLFSGSFTDPEIFVKFVNPSARLAPGSLMQTAAAAISFAGLWTLFKLLFESSAIQILSPAPIQPDSPASAQPRYMASSLPTPRFIERMSGIGVEDILALEAEDHYVRVHLRTGSELIHYRFADAVTEMGSDYGIRVHRSFWVAKPAIKEIKRGQRIEITMTNGSRIPVSNSYRFFL